MPFGFYNDTGKKCMTIETNKSTIINILEWDNNEMTSIIPSQNYYENCY